MFSKRLRKLRTDNGYSMDGLVEVYNKKYFGKMNKSTLSRYENGLQDPIYTVVVNLADLFNVSVDYLTCVSPNISIENSDILNLGKIDVDIHNEIKDLTDNQKLEVLNFVKFKKAQSSVNKDEDLKILEIEQLQQQEIDGGRASIAASDGKPFEADAPDLETVLKLNNME